MPASPAREPVYPSDLWQKRYMRELADQILKWKMAYYYALPSVDDATYDLWWRNLLFLEEKYPHLMDPASPTITPGAPLPSDSPAPDVKRLSFADLR